MIVLHGSWVPTGPGDSGQLAIWAEFERKRAARRRADEAAEAVPGHPAALPAATLRRTLQGIVPAETTRHWDTGAILARLPSRNGAPLPSPELGLADPDGDAPIELQWWSLPAILVPPHLAADVLLALSGDRPAPEIEVGDDLRAWVQPARLALELLVRQRIRPVLRRLGDGVVARWEPILEDPAEARRVESLAAALPPVARALAPTVAGEAPAARYLIGHFLTVVAGSLAEDALLAARWRPLPGRSAPAAEVWLAALAGYSAAAMAEDSFADFERRYQEWIAGGAGAAEEFRVCLKLDPPPDAPPTRRKRPPPEWTVEFLYQATDDPSLIVPAIEIWQQGGATGRLLNRQVSQPQERFLAGLGRAARICPPIERGLHTRRPEVARLSTDEAYRFLKEHAPVLQASGIGVLVPGIQNQIGLKLRIGASPSAPGRTTGPGTFGRETLIAFDWQVALGDQPLTREEFEALVALKEPLVQIRGQWVELQPDQIDRMIALYRDRPTGELSLAEAIELSVAPDSAFGLPVLDVETDGWFGDLIGQLGDGGRLTPLPEPPGFRGELRPYQRIGTAWLDARRRYGLGACLADDMGLGKTIQVIALLLQQDRPIDGPALLVVPTSVVGNWRHELARFGPDLRVLIHHGADRTRADFTALAAEHDLVITTYALLPRDEAELKQVAWSAVILDEAQNIKNAATQAARAARALPAGWRAALTGTPVENRLADLWSLFHFLTPGYLGSAEQFRKRFARPIERAQDSDVAARLKALTAPFILRRLKTDKTIISDLPEKFEQKVYCTLTREQATLYQAVVRESLDEIEGAEGIRRRGEVLAALTKLKQVCNHPALFLHDGSALPGRSGKLARLGEMLEEALAVGDRALIFSQYAEMGRLLKAYLQQLSGREVLFLHGGTPAAERDRLVARFQHEDRGPRIFVLSIKAGGIGLNLTRANHVFHFDRWWNPAVENQATDRAFRIGQQKNVQVHKFICTGTFEEALDGLIEGKVELAESIVGRGENWITELGNNDLRDLFRLRSEALSGV